MNSLVWQNPEQLFVAQVHKNIIKYSVAELKIYRFMFYFVKTTKKWQLMSSGYLARKLSLNGRAMVSVKVKLVYAIPQEDKKNARKVLSKIETLPSDSFLSVIDGVTYQPICCWFIHRYK